MGYLFNYEIQTHLINMGIEIRRLIGFIPRSSDDENYTDELRDQVINNIEWIHTRDFHIHIISSGWIEVSLKKNNVKEDVVYPDITDADYDDIHDEINGVDMFEYINELIQEEEEEEEEEDDDVCVYMYYSDDDEDDDENDDEDDDEDEDEEEEAAILMAKLEAAMKKKADAKCNRNQV